jgi:hypothetical protein
MINDENGSRHDWLGQGDIAQEMIVLVTIHRSSF